MYDVLVSIESRTGTIRRYVTGGADLLLTHEAHAGVPVTFTHEVVVEFRNKPPEMFRVPSEPYSPPPPVGGTPASVRAAA